MEFYHVNLGFIEGVSGVRHMSPEASTCVPWFLPATLSVFSPLEYMVVSEVENLFISLATFLVHVINIAAFLDYILFIGKCLF